MEKTCEYCTRKFNTFAALRRHKRIKSLCRVKRFRCSQCGSNYTSAISLKTHKKMYCSKENARSLIKSFVDNWLKPICETVVFDDTSFINCLHPNIIYDSVKRLQHLVSTDLDVNKRELIHILIFLYNQQQITLCKLVEILEMI